MNNQLKLLIYLGMMAGIFLFLQDRFKLFDIALVDKNAEEKTEQEVEENEDEEELVSYVEIYKKGGESIKVNVEVADDDASRRMGLSNRKYLGDYDGMLFIFDEKVNSAFWMKDMYIPLDILFVDTDGYIVDIKEAQEPCTANYCPGINSKSMFKYVLEVNANFCQTNGVEVGNSLVLHLDSSI